MRRRHRSRRFRYVTARLSAFSRVTSRRARRTLVTAARAASRAGSHRSRVAFVAAIVSTETRGSSCGSGRPHTFFKPTRDFSARRAFLLTICSTSATRGSRPASMRCTARADARAAPESLSPCDFCFCFFPPFSLSSFSSFSFSSASIKPALRRNSSARAPAWRAVCAALAAAFSARSTPLLTPSSSRRSLASWCCLCSSICSRSLRSRSSLSAISRSSAAMRASVSSIARRISALAFSAPASVSRRAAASASLAAAAAARATGSIGADRGARAPSGDGDGAPDRESSPDRRDRNGFASTRASSGMGTEEGRCSCSITPVPSGGMGGVAPVLLLRAKPWPHPSFLRFGAGDSGSPPASADAGAERCLASCAPGCAPGPVPANGSIVGVGAAETLFRISREAAWAAYAASGGGRPAGKGGRAPPPPRGSSPSSSAPNAPECRRSAPRPQRSARRSSQGSREADPSRG